MRKYINRITDTLMFVLFGMMISAGIMAELWPCIKTQFSPLFAIFGGLIFYFIWEPYYYKNTIERVKHKAYHSGYNEGYGKAYWQGWNEAMASQKIPEENAAAFKKFDDDINLKFYDYKKEDHVKLENRILAIIKKLDDSGTPITVDSVSTQSLFETGGTISDAFELSVTLKIIELYENQKK